MGRSKPVGVAAAIYVRISRDSEGTGLGVRRQRGDCEALVARLGWTVARVYEDNDVSATKGGTAASGAAKPRASFERLQRDVERLWESVQPFVRG